MFTVFQALIQEWIRLLNWVRLEAQIDHENKSSYNLRQAYYLPSTREGDFVGDYHTT